MATLSRSLESSGGSPSSARSTSLSKSRVPLFMRRIVLERRHLAEERIDDRRSGVVGLPALRGSIGSFTLLGFSLRVRNFGLPVACGPPHCVALVAANHGRSLHRARLSCHLADLTLYEPPLLTSLGELAVEPLKALLLGVQFSR